MKLIIGAPITTMSAASSWSMSRSRDRECRNHLGGPLVRGADEPVEPLGALVRQRVGDQVEMVHLNVGVARCPGLHELVRENPAH